MSLYIKKTPQSVTISNADGKLCGTYHYVDMFKSFFRGLYTPSGKDVVACPPPEHLHHKGLQFGLCTSEANFWEEDEVNGRLEKKMCEAFNAVLQTALKYKADLRTAAYIVAISRVATVTKMRGMYA